MDALVERVRLELRERDCGIKAFAIDCGLTREEISQILRGKKKEIRLDTLFKISWGLCVRTSELLEEMEGGA